MKTKIIFIAAALPFLALAAVGTVGFAKATASAVAGETRTGTTLPGVEFENDGERVIMLNNTTVTPSE